MKTTTHKENGTAVKKKATVVGDLIVSKGSFIYYVRNIFRKSTYPYHEGKK